MNHELDVQEALANHFAADSSSTWIENAQAKQAIIRSLMNRGTEREMNVL